MKPWSIGTTEEGRDGEEGSGNCFGCQGGITHCPRRRALGNSSKRDRPHAKLSLLPSLGAPASSLMGRAGTMLGMETFMGCSSA